MKPCSPYEIIYNDLFRIDLAKAFAPPSALPGIFLDSLMRITFATLLKKNAFAAFAAKAL